MTSVALHYKLRGTGNKGTHAKEYSNPYGENFKTFFFNKATKYQFNSENKGDLEVQYFENML